MIGQKDTNLLITLVDITPKIFASPSIPKISLLLRNGSLSKPLSWSMFTRCDRSRDRSHHVNKALMSGYVAFMTLASDEKTEVALSSPRRVVKSNHCRMTSTNTEKLLTSTVRRTAAYWDYLCAHLVAACRPVARLTAGRLGVKLSCSITAACNHRGLRGVRRSRQAVVLVPLRSHSSKDVQLPVVYTVFSVWWDETQTCNICPSFIEIGSKAAEKNSSQTNRQTNRHYENNGHLAANQYNKNMQSWLTGCSQC